MADRTALRNFVVDHLRRELVGPSTGYSKTDLDAEDLLRVQYPPPGHPTLQLDGEEILRIQDPPRQRYAAGVLFPVRSGLSQHEAVAQDEDAMADAQSPEDNRIVDHSDGARVRSTATDEAADTDHEVTLANQFLPSAMGLSALVDVPQSLEVDISAAVYRKRPLASPPTHADSGPSVPLAWWRKPIARTKRLTLRELRQEHTARFEKPVWVEDGHTVLSLHVTSRPYSRGPATRRLVTFALINRRRTTGRTPRNSECFFQCSFSVRGANGERCFLNYPERPPDLEDPEERSLRLLYRHRRVFAVAHGCAPDWKEDGDGKAVEIRTEVVPAYEIKPVLPVEIPGLDLRMTGFFVDSRTSSLTLCSRLADEYESWIDEQHNEIASVELSLQETARHHIADCRDCLRRMRAGIDILRGDSEAALAFRWMNEAMLMQAVHYGLASEHSRQWTSTPTGWALERPFRKPRYSDSDRRWYPFQLAFILMNIKGITTPTDRDREIVDLIWFPTGGGKTEAYLGLAAFSMLLRRLRDPSHGGTSVLMRYTLRLLTTQQFQRAASLLCACEMIRRREKHRLGDDRFSIGLWVGKAVTPNTEKEAVDAWRALIVGDGGNKFVLLSCPWCGAGMGPQRSGTKMKCKGYRKLPRPNRIRHTCDDPQCDFANGLPVAVIDEHIYKSPPTLVIGTVDKFAMLAFKPSARRLFGIDTSYPPPELIIQDELHLISGPLGSMVGHYETVIDALCSHQIENRSVPAKIIASTATIARSKDQIRGLYGRSSRLFPPPALRAGESFFATEKEEEIGRVYVGVFAAALSSHVTAQVRTIGTLLQAPMLYAADSEPATKDPYWTLIGYFNSIRELGHAATLIRADIREYLNALWDRLGLHVAKANDGGGDLRRFINRDCELTSRVQSSDIPGVLERLFTSYDGSRTSEVVDICFATNMIQVGLDVPRLGLMTIVGQPKTTSEYIQASSRVGRRSPGLVVTNYNPFRPRDRSHYEAFRNYHQAIYRHVEATSVTAFAPPVLDRALHALVVVLARFWGDATLRTDPRNPPDDVLLAKIRRTIRKRVRAVDPDEWKRTEAAFDAIVAKWKTTGPSRYGGFEKVRQDAPLMYPVGTPQHPDWEGRAFPTPSSMRSVDADCQARVLARGYRS